MPDLQVLTFQELIDLFIAAAKEFEEVMVGDAAMEELDTLQVQIFTIKDHIYKKSNLNPWGLTSNCYSYNSFINGN